MEKRKTCFFCKSKKDLKKLKESSRRLVVLRVYRCKDLVKCGELISRKIKKNLIKK